MILSGIDDTIEVDIQESNGTYSVFIAGQERGRFANATVMAQHFAMQVVARDNLQRQLHDIGHATIRAGIRPGLDDSCRCEMCRRTCQYMVDAGYLSDVLPADRWWE